MAQVTNKEAIKEIKELIKTISKKYSLEKAILFGSRARDDWLKNSDIDLMLVSRDFENISFRKRMHKILDYWEGELDLEVICYTPKEFEKMKKRIGIVSQAQKEGINLIK